MLCGVLYGATINGVAGSGYGLFGPWRLSDNNGNVVSARLPSAAAGAIFCVGAGAPFSALFEVAMSHAGKSSGVRNTLPLLALRAVVHVVTPAFSVVFCSPFDNANRALERLDTFSREMGKTIFHLSLAR